MRKCLRCGNVMNSNLKLKVNGGGYGIVVSINKKLSATTIGDVKVAVCPECGYMETYIDDTSELKKIKEEE